MAETPESPVSGNSQINEDVAEENEVQIPPEPKPEPPRVKSVVESKVYNITPNDSNDPSYSNLVLPYVGSNPLALWDKQVKNGHIRRVIDEEVKSLVLDIGGTNVATTYITCPIKPRASLGVKLPYLVMIIKNMKKYFTFEIQILDDKDMRRRFRVSNFQSTTKVRPFCTTMPIGLSSGWNQVQFNLADFTKRAYGSAYMETVRVQIHANVRIRRIYFTDQLHSDDDLPNEFKLFTPGPGAQKAKAKAKSSKDAIDAQDLPVPALKTDKKEDEEVPPPPSPAEESPVPKEEDVPPPPEGEAPPEGEEAVVTEEGEVKPATEGAEGEQPIGEEGAAPIEGDVVVEEGTLPEGEAPIEGAEGAEVAEPQEGGESAPTEPPEEGEISPVEGEEPKGEALAEGEVPPAEGPEPEEAGGEPTEETATEITQEETTVEASETVAETETVEVTETTVEASEPATTDAEGEESP